MKTIGLLTVVPPMGKLKKLIIPLEGEKQGETAQIPRGLERDKKGSVSENV